MCIRKMKPLTRQKTKNIPGGAAPGGMTKTTMQFHLAVPEKPFGLTQILRFFDRCG